MSKKLSGAQRRKLTKEKNAACEGFLSKVPKLMNFFTTAPANSSVKPESEITNFICDPITDNNNDSLETSQQFLSATGTTVSPLASTSNSSICDKILNKPDFQDSSQELDENQTTVIIDNVDFSKKVNETNLSNDPSTWPEHLTVRERDAIVLMDPLPFLADDKEYPRIAQRHFSNEFQYRIAQNGEKIKRRWLVYSQSSDAAFCVPCRLFDITSKSNFGKKEGFNKWKKFVELATAHETSPVHFCCIQKWIESEKRLKQGQAIDQQLIDEINAEAERWKNILKRIVSVIMYLAENNIAFRGSSTKLFSKNNGNFLGLIQLLGEFDPIMMEHIRRIEAKEYRSQMLSVNIQNELINLLAKQVKESIVRKIKIAKYFSVILDCTPDKSHREQASLTIRYVHEESETNGEIIVEESFMGYSVAKESTGEALADLLKQEIESCGLDLDNCRGQGYDNGANMAGIEKGVQARIISKHPLALYTPCGCHSLNLVVSDGVRTSVKSTLLFGILQRIYTIFAASHKRWCVVSDHVQSLTLKQVCDTRWEARINSVSAIRYQYGSVLNALENLSEDSSDATVSSEAKSLQMHMEDFSFLVCLIIWHDVLFEVNLVSKILQGKTADISLASDQLNRCTKFMVKFRDCGLNDSIAKAKEIANDLGIDPVFQEKRSRTRKKLLPYESSDDYKPTAEELFKRDVFYPIIDKILNSLKDRMDTFSEHQSKWGFLYNLKNLPEKEELLERCVSLQHHLTVNEMSDINGRELYNELLHVDAIRNEIISNEKQISPLEALKIIKKTDRKDLFTNLWICLRELLTIPVTVASCERSFSKLKLIKTYLRSSMSQERLTSLAILSIENEEAKKLNLETIIDEFAKSKARKIPV